MKHLFFIIALFCLSNHPVICRAQECQIYSAVLAKDFQLPAKIPITRDNNTFHLLVRSYQWEIKILTRSGEDACLWMIDDTRLPWPVPNQLPEYINNDTGLEIIYYGNYDSLFYREADSEPPDPFRSAYCRGRPVLDQMNNIHAVWTGESDTLFYAFSTDTLASIGVSDTIIAPGTEAYMVSSPDNSICAAVILYGSSNSIRIYPASSGQPVDFEGYYREYFLSLQPYIIYDIAMNLSGNLTMLLREGIGDPGEIYYIWSEGQDPQILRSVDSFDSYGTVLESMFSDNGTEIIILDNALGGLTRFHYSLDSGQTWELSNFTINFRYFNSAPRTYSDSLHICYNVNWVGPVHYLRLDKSEIIWQTNIEDNEMNDNKLTDLGNHPNPFNTFTTIQYSAPDNGNVRISIFDIAGRLVITLLDGESGAGPQSVFWNGQNSAGEDVTSGIYYYRIEAGDYSDYKKMILLK